MTTSPEDFCFCYIDDSSYHHFKPKAGIPIVQMFTDYDGGGALSVANDFLMVEFSYAFVFTIGMKYDLDPILEDINPKPTKAVPESNY